MFQDNPLLAQLKQQLRDNIPKKEGVVRGSDRGFGFLETDNRESYFIPPQQMKKVMHGDRITALIRTENEKEQAEPDSLITPFLTRFVGRIKLIKDRLNVVPDHPVLKEVIKARPIKGLDEKQFAEGDWVVANLKRHGLTDGSHFAEISELITASEDPEAPWWVVLRRHDLARSHSADFAEQAQQRQNDEVLEALLAEAEAGMRQVELAQRRLAEGRYGVCQCCAEAINPARLEAMPAAEHCLNCAGKA